MDKNKGEREGDVPLGNSKELAKIIEFKAAPVRCLFNSENFKIYGCVVDSFKYPDVKINSYNNATIKGDIQELNLDCEYLIKGEETQDKYGISYKVINIKSEKPTTIESSRAFLNEILTYQQADTLLSVYPDIIDRIINNRLRDVDLSKTKGIKEATFTKIKVKVIENFKLAELVEEFSGVFSFSVIKKLYQAYPSIERIRENLHKQPYKCLCKLGGIGFKIADELLLKVDTVSKERIKNGKKPIVDFGFDLISSYQRMEACALYILDENETNGNTYMDSKEFIKTCSEYVPEAKHHLKEIMKKSFIFDLNNDIFCDVKRSRVSKIKTYSIEKNIADILNTGLSSKNLWNTSCIDVEKYRQINGNTSLTDEQMQTIYSVCKNPITILQGFAGTGKSMSVLALINLLNDLKKSALLLAPTGRASKVLQKYTNHPASTIHRGLHFIPHNEWGFDEKNKLPYDIVILDESSMVDIYLFKHLLDAIDFNRTKLLIIGDNAQIPSVSCGNVLHDLLNSKVIPTVYLTRVFRYGEGGLSTVATDIRQGKMTFENKTNVQAIGDDNGCVFAQMPPERAVDYIIKAYQKLLNNGIPLKDIMFVVAQNKGKYGTQIINNQIQKAINPNAEQKIISGDTEYRIGDPVIQCANDYNSQIYSDEEEMSDDKVAFISNGDIGIVSKIMNNCMVVDFDDFRIYIPREKFINIKLAYAISIHKSQGGQAKYVIAFIPNTHTFMLNSNLLYVAVTRAKEKCYIISDILTFSRAIKKKENFTRQTWLKDLLKEKNYD